jgi:hypothetical protein
VYVRVCADVCVRVCLCVYAVSTSQQRCVHSADQAHHSPRRAEGRSQCGLRGAAGLGTQLHPVDGGVS